MLRGDLERRLDGAGAWGSAGLASRVSVPAGASLASLPRSNRGGGRWEEDDGYARVVMRTGDVRVISCRDGIQWIVQHLVSGRWHSDKFCRSRSGLIFWAWPLPSDALAVLEALPERHA
jgi:hypothetical protein